ncbi:MAG: DUF6984 family protein [Caulobacteraceae bacterium]
MPRPILPDEVSIVRRLLSLAGVDDPRLFEQGERALVEEMDDGGMGSIRFICEPPKEHQIFGREVARGVASDGDGVPLSLAVNVDQDGDLFELDIWKVDFSKLKRHHPDPDDIRGEPVIQP